MDEYKIIRFGDLKEGEHFDCWGDEHFPYDVPVWSHCIKDGPHSAQEIKPDGSSGVRWLMDNMDRVYPHIPEK